MGVLPRASGFALVMNITGVLARVFVADLEAAIPLYRQDGPLALAADRARRPVITPAGQAGRPRHG
jgi:hypothetical protein